MMRIKPFQALRPAQSHADRVASVPYDTLNRSEAAALALNNPFSFLHVTRSEIDLPEETAQYDESVYEKALENFQSLQRQGILVKDSDPCLYLYRLTKGAHTQLGVVACYHVDDYSNNIIRKHENTRKEKETDRTRLTSKLNAHTGPVLIMYRDQPDVSRITRRIENQAALYEFAAPDGVTHTIWRIRNSRPLVTAFQQVPVSYIADGHHRAAGSLRVAMEKRAGRGHQEGEEYNWFLGVLFPASQLRILPYNRSVRDLNGKTTQAFLEAVQSEFTVTANADACPLAAAHISMYLGGQWYGLSWGRSPSTTDPVASLDVSVLQSRLLEPILGVQDPRTDRRIEYIGGVRDTDSLEEMVNSGQAAVVFSMFPTSVNQLMAIADAGDIMPPKSTWFEPKPMSGLLIHPF